MKNIPLVFLCVCILVSFFGCTDVRSTNTTQLLIELSHRSEQNTERAFLFESEAKEGDITFLSEGTKIALYGDKRSAECFPLIEEYAILLCTNGVGELAVFKCFSESDTDLVAAMCLERADLLKVALKSTSFADKSADISVTIRGKYVLMAFTDHNRSVCERFLKMI